MNILLIISGLGFLICHVLLVYLFHKRMKLTEDMVVKIINNGVLFRFPDSNTEKKMGTNRNPRTEEQKAKASAKRKEWWANKKALESKTPEPSKD